MLHNIRLAKVRCLGKADIEHSLVQVCFSPIMLKKSILIEFSGPLVRLTRYDVGGTSISAKATIDELTRRPLLLNYFRFRGIADMAGLAAGSTQS